MKITYTYDALDHLVEAAWDDGRRVCYTYDAAGNRLTVSLPGQPPPPAEAAAAPAPPAPSSSSAFPATCPNCGQPLSPGAKFCRRCGVRLNPL